MEKESKKATKKVKEVKIVGKIETEIANENVNVEVLDLDDKKVFKIILLPISGMVKKETEKEVSGNVAKILIKKGFASLKKIRK